VDSSSIPDIVNLHQTSEMSGSFDIVLTSATESGCDASSYNVVATPSAGQSIRLSVTGLFVDLKNLKTSVPYEITVEAVCTDGSVSQKSPAALLLKTMPLSSLSVLSIPTNYQCLWTSSDHLIYGRSWGPGWIHSEFENRMHHWF